MTEERPPLGGRYAIQRPLEQSSERFFAVAETSGKRVVVALVDVGRLSTLEPARDIRHRHLAGIVDIVRDIDAAQLPAGAKLPAGGVAVVAEHVPGRTLHAQIAENKLHPAKAVAWILRLADALQGLHAAGAVHGALSPRSVIGEPAGRAIAPVLSQLVVPPMGGFLPPERLKGAAEAQSDDVWGLYATLYAAVTGSAPFKAPTREALLKAALSKPKPLSAFGVEEPVLQEILQRGMLPDRHARATELSELVEALDSWERDPEKAPPKRAAAPRPGLRGLGDIVGGTLGPARDDGIVVDDESLPDDQGTDLPEGSSPQAVVVPLAAAGPRPPRAEPAPAPPGEAPSSPAATAAKPDATPLPQAAPEAAAAAPGQPVPPGVPPVKKRISINPFERKTAIWPWVIVAAIAGGGGVYLAVAPSAPEPAKKVEAPPPPKPKPKPAAPPKRDPVAMRDECVAAHFPTGSFEGTPSFAFVCQDDDFVATTRKLHSMVKPPDAADAGADASTGDASAPVEPVKAAGKPATIGGLGLDWYELPATAIIKKTCCPASVPVTLPETRGWCEQLQSVVRRVAEDSQKAVDLAQGARAFDKAVTCLFANKIQHPYAYTKPTTPANRAAFQQFISRAAVISAQR